MGEVPAVRESQIEQALLSRTFFRPEDLLLAETNDGAVAWLQVCLSPEEPNRFVVPTICLGIGADFSLTVSLLEEAEKRAAAAGARQFQVGVVRDQLFGYAGLDPIGHGIGISTSDERVFRALESKRYEPLDRWIAMRVAVSSFRPPVTREALQYRRSTQVSVEGFTFEDHRRAAAMSHLDIEKHHLLDRTGQTLASVGLWHSDPEAEVMQPTKVILDLGDANDRGRLNPAECYLVAASIQAAANRHLLCIETSVEEGADELIAQLEAMRFDRSQSGVLWLRPL